jgi:peptidoglycan hydrolase-like protein with peptidoglycan-binding domain
MILWSTSSIGKRVSLFGVLAVSVWLLTGTPAYGQAATAPATSTAAAKKTIQAAQERLLALGYQPGAADGVMGAKGIAALKKFQADRSLPVTGQLDRKTLDALDAAPPTPTTTTPAAKVQEAEVSDGFTLRVQGSRQLSHFADPMAGGSWGSNGVEAMERRPQSGNIFLAVQLAVQNSGSAAPMTREQVTLRPPLSAQGSESYAPFFWQEILANGIGRSSNTINFDSKTVVNIIVEVPELNPEKLVLWFGGHSRGSLESLGLTGNQ